MDKIKQGVQEVVNQLYLTHGEVKSSALVEAAKPKTSPAHDGFEWDNRKAASEYRLWQARSWIRRVEIVQEDRTERLVHVPAIRTGEEENPASEGYYKPLSIITQDETEYQAALNEALGKLNSARSAYEVLKKASKSQIDFERADTGFEMVQQAMAAA